MAVVREMKGDAIFEEKTPEDRVYEGERDLWRYVLEQIKSGRHSHIFDNQKQLRALFSYLHGEWLNEVVGGSLFEKQSKQLGLELPRGFTRYSRDVPGYGFQRPQSLAYGCNACGKIIVGAPKLELISQDADARVGLSGLGVEKHGLRYICKNPTCMKVMLERRI